MNVEFVPDVGDLIWTVFDPTVGREQKGRRPALVVSHRDFYLLTRFVIVCPITSRVRPFPSSVVLPAGLPVAGEILVSAVKTIDGSARPVEPIFARIPAETAAEVRAKLLALVTIGLE